MAAHVIRSDREEEGCPDLITAQDLEKRRNSVPGTVISIDIDSQTNFHKRSLKCLKCAKVPKVIRFTRLSGDAAHTNH